MRRTGRALTALNTRQRHDATGRAGSGITNFLTFNVNRTSAQELAMRGDLEWVGNCGTYRRCHSRYQRGHGIDAAAPIMCHGSIRADDCPDRDSPSDAGETIIHGIPPGILNELATASKSQILVDQQEPRSGKTSK